MKKSRELVKNDGAKEIVIEGAAKTFSLHAKFNSTIGFIQVYRNMTDDGKILAAIVNMCAAASS